MISGIGDRHHEPSDAMQNPFQSLKVDPWKAHERVNKLRLELDEVQKALDTNPTDSILREKEYVYVQAFNEAKLDEERFLKQKAKVDWLEAGDTNLAYFYKTIKCRNQRSRIDSILNIDNVEVSGSLVPDVFVSHYEQFLSAMFDIGDDRTPGPDGYTSVFFKKGMEYWKRGLRQGDPLSPYLFTLVMEILTLILKRRVPLLESFRYHHYCEEIYLINVCLADDLFNFARGDVESSRVIIDSLEEFKLTSGLIPSIPKSATYFWILNRDCKILVEKSKNSIGDWKTILYHLREDYSYTWLLKAPYLGLITCPVLVSSVVDLWQWCDGNGNILSFYVTKAWEAIRSHDKRTVKSVFGKLILAASAYFIWMEQNNRTFKNTSRSPEEIRDLIMVTVRLKLISFRFKNTNVVTGIPFISILDTTEALTTCVGLMKYNMKIPLGVTKARPIKFVLYKYKEK
nr:hypothetical protein [Tanacetum cinerariifolium]